jgi:hypothetical protein
VAPAPRRVTGVGSFLLVYPGRAQGVLSFEWPGRTFAWSIDLGTDALKSVKAPRHLPSAYGAGSYWTLGRSAILMTPARS